MRERVKKSIMTILLCIITGVIYAKPPYEHLRGEWEFYLEKPPVQVFKIISENGSPDLMTEVPGFWNKDIEKLRNQKYAHTFGCYRKVISNLNPDQKYALLLKDAPQSACAVYVNRRIVSQNGNPFLFITGKRLKPSDSIIKPMYADFYPDKNGNIEIVVLVANYMYRKSGLWDSFIFGTEKIVSTVNAMNICFYNTIFGILIFISLLNVIQFFINRQKKEYLYLGIVAFALAMRIGTAGYCSLGLMFSWFNAEIKIKCEYLALWVVPAFIIKTIGALYPIEDNDCEHKFSKEKILTRILIAILYTLGLLSIVLPGKICNHLVPVLEGAELVAVFYEFGLCIHHMIHKRKYIVLLFIGSVILTAGSIFDFVYTKLKEVLPVSTFPLFVLVFIFFFLALLAAFQNNIYKETIMTSNNLKKLNEAYLRFVPKEFLTMIGKDDITKVKLGDFENIELPIIFSKSEISGTETPEETFAFFNEYLETVAPVIKKHDGFISKFLSGGFIAIFKTNSGNALNASIEILEACRVLNEKYKDSRICIKTNIGLNYGKMILGTIGEEHRLDDTVISDTVNTASRIESACEKLSIPLIISEKVKEKIDGNKISTSYSLIPLNPIALKGKSEPLQLYECRMEEV